MAGYLTHRRPETWRVVGQTDGLKAMMASRAQKLPATTPFGERQKDGLIRLGQLVSQSQHLPFWSAMKQGGGQMYNIHDDDSSLVREDTRRACELEAHSNQTRSSFCTRLSQSYRSNTFSRPHSACSWSRAGWFIASTSAEVRSSISSTTVISRPASSSNPSAPMRVVTTGVPLASASRILRREPPPIRNGTTSMPQFARNGLTSGTLA